MSNRRPKKLQPVLVSGGKNAGKTSYLLNLVERARMRGWRVGGFVSLAEWEHGEKKRYFLRDVSGNRQRLVARKGTHRTDEWHVGSYVFDPETFRWAQSCARQPNRFDVFLLDEFGPLERKGLGLSPILEMLLAEFNGILVISVRPALLPDVLQMLKKATTGNVK